MQGEERIDGYIVYRNDNIFTNSASLTLFRAMNTMNQTMCVCQVVGDGGLDKIKGYEYTSRLDMVNKFGFKGYLKLVHHKIMNTSSYFFFHVEGPIESSAQLMRNGYQFSNVELTRIGLLMLDSYAYYVSINAAHQDIDLEHIVLENHNTFLLVPPIRWAIEVRVLDRQTVNYKPPESLQFMSIDSRDFENLHKKFVWKFGLIMFFLMNKKLPFNFIEANNNDANAQINESTTKKFVEFITYRLDSKRILWLQQTQQLNEIIKMCLVKLLSGRISFHALHQKFRELHQFYQPTPVPQTNISSITANIQKLDGVETRGKSHTMNLALYNQLAAGNQVKKEPEVRKEKYNPFDDDYDPVSVGNDGKPITLKNFKFDNKVKIKIVPDCKVTLKSNNKSEQKNEIKNNLSNLRLNIKTKGFSKPAEQSRREVFESQGTLYDVDPDLDTEISEKEVDEFLNTMKENQIEKEKKASNLNLKVNLEPPSTQMSKLQSQLKIKSQLSPVLPAKVDTEKTLELIERNEINKIKQEIERESRFSNDYYGANNSQTSPRDTDEEDFSEINDLLNLIRKRIIFHLEVGKTVKKLIRSVYAHGFTYCLVFHVRNLVNQVLQILSGEQSAASSFPHNWDRFMDSHDHSLQTNSFALLSEKVYMILYNSYDKLQFLTDSSNSNSHLREVGKLIYHPDNDELTDITKSIELMMIAVCSSLDKRANMKDLRMRISAVDNYKSQLKISVCLMITTLGLFADRDVYSVYDLDELIENVDSMNNENALLNKLLEFNNQLRELES